MTSIDSPYQLQQVACLQQLIPIAVLHCLPLLENDQLVDFRYSWVNQKAVELSGRGQQAFEHQTMLTLFPSARASGLFNRFVQVWQMGDPLRFEHPYTRQDRTGWIDITIDKQYDGLLITATDITPFKEAQLALEQQTQQLLNIAQQLPAGLVLFEPVYNPVGDLVDFRYGLTNPANAHTLGSSVEDLTGRNLLELYPAARRLGTFGRLKQVLETGVSMQYQTQYQADGLDLRVEGHLTRIDQGVLMMYLDQTSLQQQAQQLQDKNEELHLTNQALTRVNLRLEGLQAIERTLLDRHSSDQSPEMTALAHTRQLVPCQQLVVYQFDQEMGLARSKSWLVGRKVAIHIGSDLPAHLFHIEPLLSGQPWVIDQLQPQQPGLPPELLLYQRGYRSLLVVPLFSQQQYIGAFILLAQTPHFFTQEYQQIAQEVGSQLAIVLEQQRMEQQLKAYTQQLESRVRYRTRQISQLSALQQAILKHAGQAIVSTDLHGVIQTANPAGEKLLGYGQGELLGRQVWMSPKSTDQKPALIGVQASQTARPVWKIIEPVLATHEYFHGECHVLTQTGVSVPVLLTASVLQDEAGTRVGYVGIATDISALKAAEKQLRNLNQRFELATQAVGQGIWENDLEQGKLIWDDRLWEMHGIEPQGPDWSLREYINLVHPDDRASFLAGTHYVSPEDRLANVSRIIRPDGRLIYVEHQALVVRNPQGAPVRVIGVTWDVTERKQAEQALQQALQREQELNRLKSQFVSTASHEFRTPLTTIQSSADLMELYLKQPPEIAGPVLEKHLKVIGQQVHHLDGLLSDLLTMGRIEAGRVAFTPQQVDLSELCQQVIADHFSHQPDGRVVQVSVAGASYRVNLDKKLMGHVLTNLLSNAFKFSQTNPRLVIRFEDQMVVLEVIDEGIGIPAQDLPTLFQTFSRARNTTAIQGTGLGLVIARQYVELHGGTLTVQSQEQQGSTFRLILPR
ncbi:PAS domain S-box-containing protein [Larkinella arboricola]|uniref:histidine kinase n=1 Tax=Larkinella arboricola TaxID=643671 RepID=A0A327WGE5_LARAB|nr:PAS domain S-box protein [Larkinella arboricola]RAJ89852.1 PAS domain S-box-containing protein [Larkinella arboricola]